MQQMIHNNIICRRTARRRRNRLTVSTQFPRDPQSTCFHCISTWTFTVAPQTGRSADTKLGTVQMQHWQQTYCTLFSVAPQTEFGRRFVMRVCAGCTFRKSTSCQYSGSSNTMTLIYLVYSKKSYSLPLHYSTQRQKIN